jgi:hypothetical protein
MREGRKQKEKSALKKSEKEKNEAVVRVISLPILSIWGLASCSSPPLQSGRHCCGGQNFLYSTALQGA